MDVIISALVWGIKSAGKKAFDTTMSAGLELLKKKILDSAKESGDVASSLERLEKNPSAARQAALKEDMSTAGVSDKEEIIAAARALLESTSEGKEILSITQSVHVGDGGKAAIVAGENNNISIS